MATEDDLQDVEIALDANDMELGGKKDGEERSEPPKAPESAPKQGGEFDDLRSQLDNYRKSVEIERQRREEAERRAAEREQEAYAYRSQAQDGQLGQIEAAIRAVEAEAANAERALEDASAAGNHSVAAKAQRVIAAAEAKLLQLNNGRAALTERLQYEQQRQRQPAQQQQSEQRQPATAEEAVSQWADNLTPASRDWVKSHLREMADPKISSKVQAAHMMATQVEGLEIDTPEYFRRVEEISGIGGRQSEQRQSAPPARKPTPAAPVQQSSSGYSQSTSPGQTPSKVRLTAAMREAAHFSFPDMPKAEAERLYAVNLAKSIAKGEISQ